MNKTTGFLLLGLAAAGAVYLWTRNSGSQWTPPPGAQPIYPGQTYQGVVNTSSDAIWLTATGQLVNSLGQAFSSIYTAVQSNQGGTTGSGVSGYHVRTA